ncbi:MAG: SurA N-terminal domain-containing protein [Terriglobales bacterium]
MRRWLQIGVMALACVATAAAGEIIDRIVATVNGQPILQSDWDVASRYEAFMDQHPLRYTPEAARATLERLIDQELLRQQIRGFQLRAVGAEEVRVKMAEIRKQTPDASTEAGWQACLNRYGLTESELEERVATQLQILRFIDVRLRPTVHVDRRSIEAYYRDKLLPELKQKNAREVPLAEVSPQIEDILFQQRMDALLGDLLHELRQQSRIHVQDAPVSAGVPTGQEAR